MQQILTRFLPLAYFLQAMHYLSDRLTMKQARVLERHSEMLCQETVAQDCQELLDKTELLVT